MADAFHREELLDRVDGDWDFLAETVQMLCDDGHRLMAEIRTAAASGDAAAVGRSAHTLKGMISNFVATDAAEAARVVEALGKRGELSAAPDAIAGLEMELDRLIAALTALLATRPRCAS